MSHLKQFWIYTFGGKALRPQPQAWQRLSNTAEGMLHYVTRAPAADRSGAVRGDHKGLGQGHLYPQGGSPGGRDRLAGRHLPLGGELHLPGT